MTSLQPALATLGANPPNKSIVGLDTAAGDLLAERDEREESPSNWEVGDFSWLDNMSVADAVLCTGGVVPIDKRSNRTSVPLFGAGLLPENIGRFQTTKKG